MAKRLSILAFFGMAVMLCALLVWGDAPGSVMPAQATAQVYIGAGDSGGIPAIAFIPAGSAPLVILPGSRSDALELRDALQQRGYGTLELLFMPVRSPHHKGAAVLSRGFTIRQFTAVRMKNARLDWRQLRDELSASGTAVNELAVASDAKVCTYEFQRYIIIYRQLPDGLFSGELRLREDSADDVPPLFAFELLKSGELQIKCASCEPMRIAKSNRAQSIVIPVPVI